MWLALLPCAVNDSIALDLGPQDIPPSPGLQDTRDACDHTHRQNTHVNKAKGNGSQSNGYKVFFAIFFKYFKKKNVLFCMEINTTTSF